MMTLSVALGDRSVITTPIDSAANGRLGGVNTTNPQEPLDWLIGLSAKLTPPSQVVCKIYTQRSKEWEQKTASTLTSDASLLNSLK